MAILPNANGNVTIGYGNPWAPHESVAIGSNPWSNSTIDGTISHNYSYNYDKLWEFLYYSILDRELDATKRDTYATLLKINKNDFRNTVLAIEMEKNENPATEI